jgi:tRNA(Ile)-lysidine synthase
MWRRIASEAVNFQELGENGATMHSLETKLRENWQPADWQDVTVLIGVSGGPDSVALFRAMLAIRTGGEGRIVVGHFHHGLRGSEADADAAFVESLCRQFSVPCRLICEHVRVLAAEGKNSLEEAARKARYGFLRQTAEEMGARFIVTGHNADDQAETILHHILRGTGIRGLGGMRRSRPLHRGLTLIRPFLPFRRSEIVEYLTAIGQPFREDESNRDTSFTRNRLRHDLIPLLAQQFNPSIVDALLRLGQTAREARAALLPSLKDLAERSIHDEDGSVIAVNCQHLAGRSRHLARELFVMVWGRQGWPQQAMSFEKWDELAGMAFADPVDGKTDKRMFPGGVTAERTGGRLRLHRNA